jgi:hypothetical protein
MKKKCSHCGEPSLKGLKKGVALCRYHYAVLVWGKEWADRVIKEEKSNETR